MPARTPTTDTWRQIAHVALDRGDIGQFTRKLKTRSLVGHALEEGRVRLFFQPVVQASAGGSIAFWEALIRLRKPDGSFAEPGQFLPAIAGTSLAVMLDCEVLRQVLHHLEERGDLRLSVNVGKDAYAHPEWMAVLTQALRRAPEIAHRLIVEITEDIATLDHPGSAEFLSHLREAGISLALDDFGGGTTSIRQFRDTRFDILKLDGSLCRSLHEDRDTQALVGAMIGIAQHYEMLTVAEHIDSQECAAAATRVGVDSLQGYEFGRPQAEIPLRDAARTLRTGS